VNEFYSNLSPTLNESWYITPIGNPSGTKMTKDQLSNTLESIIHHNPNAIIILDTVYARTLTEEDAKELFSGIVNSKKLMNRIIFLDSFSKSHGLCNERLGIYFSVNEDIFTDIHTANITYSAGPGVIKDFQFKVLGNMPKELNKGISDLHWFWGSERKGLVKYLTQDKFKHLFEKEQVHIRDEDLDRPCTLYISLKTKEGIKAQQVFETTGALGVDTKFKSGHYIRFSVGTLTRPVYSKMD